MPSRSMGFKGEDESPDADGSQDGRDIEKSRRLGESDDIVDEFLRLIDWTPKTVCP